jgi:hypothetical protein
MASPCRSALASQGSDEAGPGHELDRIMPPVEEPSRFPGLDDPPTEMHPPRPTTLVRLEGYPCGKRRRDAKETYCDQLAFAVVRDVCELGRIDDLRRRPRAGVDDPTRQPEVIPSDHQADSQRGPEAPRISGQQLLTVGILGIPSPNVESLLQHGPLISYSSPAEASQPAVSPNLGDRGWDQAVPVPHTEMPRPPDKAAAPVSIGRRQDLLCG